MVHVARCFLTSGEANIRNLQYGLEMAEEFGQVEKIGYFPDTFGLYGQVPQLMRQAGFDTVVFGRGVNPTGFNNQVFDSAFASKYSEMFWESPDGSKVLGFYSQIGIPMAMKFRWIKKPQSFLG